MEAKSHENYLATSEKNLDDVDSSIFFAENFTGTSYTSREATVATICTELEALENIEKISQTQTS